MNPKLSAKSRKAKLKPLLSITWRMPRKFRLQTSVASHARSRANGTPMTQSNEHEPHEWEAGELSKSFLIESLRLVRRLNENENTLL